MSDLRCIIVGLGEMQSAQVATLRYEPGQVCQDFVQQRSRLAEAAVLVWNRPR
jgi:hypothetical protein